jgi:hypothetical protein
MDSPGLLLQYTVAMMGYGSEDKDAVLELTYNYGVTEYAKGNAYAQVCNLVFLLLLLLRALYGRPSSRGLTLDTHDAERSSRSPLAPTMSTGPRRRRSCLEARWCGSRGPCQGSTPRSQPSWTLMAGNWYCTTTIQCAHLLVCIEERFSFIRGKSFLQCPYIIVQVFVDNIDFAKELE